MRKNIKEKVVRLIGYSIGGEAVLDMWGGGQGTIEIEKEFLPVKHFSKDNALRCVNDNGFGCERIVRADVYIEEKYDDGGRGKIIWIEADSDYSRSLFLGWKHLNALKENDL